MVLEDEIACWKVFRRALLSDEDREAFEEIMDLCRIYASESSNFTNPIIFEPMVMSIVLGYQKKLHKHKRKINDVLKDRSEKASLELRRKSTLDRGIRLSRIKPSSNRQ